MLSCAKHPTLNAQYECNECLALACPHCVSSVWGGGVEVVTCVACGAACHPIVASEEDAQGFFQRLPSVFVFPFINNGYLLILGGVLLFWVIDLLASSPLFGIIAAMIGAGFYGGFLMHVVAQSAAGQMDDGPEWPDYQDIFTDVLGPFFRICTFIVLLALPVAGALYLESTALTLIAALLVAAYAPMAFVAISLFQSVWACLNVVAIGRAIAIAPLQYLVAWLLFMLLFGVGFGFSALEAMDLGFLPSLAARFLGIYVAIVEMRVLGLLYRTNSDEIAWV